MMMMGTYEIIEKLRTDRKHALYRARDTADGAIVLMKIFQDEGRYAEDSFILKREYDLLNEITVPDCTRALRLESVDGYPAMLLEDPKGNTLRQYLTMHPLELSQRLGLAVRMVALVANLHAADIIHKNLNLSSFYISDEQHLILGEFELAEHLGKKQASSYAGMGNPLYTSPEQTGRTSRPVDLRSDIYSLGVAFYELFCGRHPFDASDINGLIYAHMTQIPMFPSARRPELPEALSAIVMKMLEKEPGDRYQSARGLQTDLEWVLKHLYEPDHLKSFTAGRSDVSVRFVVPEKAYGKAQIIDSLEVFRTRTQYGENRVVILEGVKNSGKSFLLNELSRRWMAYPGVLIHIDLTTLDVVTPYHAVRLVMDSFIGMIQNSSSESQSVFSEKLAEAVGSNRSLLLSIIPKISKLLPGIVEEPHLDQFERKPLIDRLLLSLADLVISYDPPFIALVDGLDRMDSESAKVLQLMMHHRPIRSMLVIGTVSTGDHAPVELMELMTGEESRFSVERIKIPEYSIDDIQLLIRDAFGIASKKAMHLSRLIYSKTNGNPHYTMNFILKCCEEGWIAYSMDVGGWTYNASEIERFQIMVNVADQALEKIRHLEPVELEVLQIAAGMGFEIPLESLAEVVRINSSVLSGILARALRFGLIAGRFGSSGSELSRIKETLLIRFSHDSVYRHLLGMLDEAGRMEVSYAYGRLLQEKGSTSTEELGFLLEHLNRAIPLLKVQEEKSELARLNLEYALRLKWIGVLAKALEHTETGILCLAEVLFDDRDQLAYRLHLERAELAYLNRRFEVAEVYFDDLIARCVQPINQAKAIRIKMNLYVNQGKMRETIHLAEQALMALGLRFSGEPSDIMVARELLIYNIRSSRKSIDSLERLPVSTDAEIYLITQIYMTLISVSYLVGKNLFIYVILKILNMTMKHGLTIHSSYAFSIYGLIAGSAMGNPIKGLAYGDLGIRLAERFGNQDMLTKCHFTYGFFLNHWVKHPSGNIPHLKKAIELSYQTGDMVFYSYSVAAYILSLMDEGTTLNTVLNAVDRYFDSVQDKHVDDVFNLLVLLRQYIFTLRGETDGPTRLNALDFDEARFEELLKSSSMQSITAVYLVLKLKLCYLYGEYDEAGRICKRLKNYTQELMGLSVYPEYYQYYSLTLLETARGGDDGRQIIAGNQNRLAKWMRFAPQNFTHRYMTVKGVAEHKRGNHGAAVRVLTEALQSAQKQGFLQDEALINELLASCYEHTNQVMIRRMYLRNAYVLYHQWGASAKVGHLKEKYRDITFEGAEDRPFREGLSLNPLDDGASRQVDLLSVFKAAQTLSSETHPRELFRRLLGVISENAGAQKTVILIKKEMLHPVAWSTPAGVVIHEEGDLTGCEYPETVINQTARNLEPIVIEDVSKVAAFRKDPYVIYNNPISMMCIPVQWKGSLVGVLYLENNRMSGAFNRSRLEVMQVLTAQFVISYDNALLYENLRVSESLLKEHKYRLERIVEERTAEVTRANLEIQMLLDHAGQGFFSFDENGRIGSELSRECHRIFQKNICGELVADLLGSFSKDEDAQLIGRIIAKAFKTSEVFDAKVYLSLLPQTLTIRDRIITIEYQMIEDTDSRRVMTILTDITETHALMLVREEEKRNLKMIVKIIRHRNAFLRSLEDYYSFVKTGLTQLVRRENDPQQTLIEMFRLIHTFKGDFAQWGLGNTESALHEIESLIAYQRTVAESMADVEDFTEELDFDKVIGKDLQIIEDAIGKSFLQGDEHYEISRTQVVALEEMVDAEDFEALGVRIKALRLVNLKDLLLPYDDYVVSLAFGLDKKINPIMIVGDDLMIDRKHYHNLIKVLIHIFRNMVDYGIEDPEERLLQGKPESGTITCSIETLDSGRVWITLEDDGSGIDPMMLRTRLIERHPDCEDAYSQLTDHELIQLIFSDGVSTSDGVTMLSGRGIGLSAVREEVEKLGGTIQVHSIIGSGTRFILDLPVLH